MKKFYIPKTLKIEDIAALFESISGFLARKQDVEINFSKVRFAYPSGIIYSASKIRQFLDSGTGEFKVTGINTSINKSHSYLAHIGFWKFIDQDIGRELGKAKANENYIPITKIDFEEYSEMGRRPFEEEIHHRSKEMAQIVVADSQPDVYWQFAYNFQETIRNVYEHAASKYCLVFGQKYEGGQLGLIVADNGSGILKGLSAKYKLTSDKEAVSWAIKPGISCKNEEDFDEDDKWANSGFGLYILSEFARRIGSLRIISGNAHLFINEKKQELTNFYGYQGTFVELRLSQLSYKDFKQIREEIVRFGEAEIGDTGERQHRASKSKVDF